MMIPNLTVEMTSTLAPFGYAALVAVGVGLIAVVSAAFRARVRTKAAVRYARPAMVRRAAARGV
jgi:hypothetical protein